ncbi:MAG: enoyl-CoA hydratase/isomerase family protein [Myxococcales bacterium]|nr:enoyl-CoA hydratase/isomerase family protein [Myxococcales bacterium]
MVVTVPKTLDAASLVGFAERLEASEEHVVLVGGDEAFCLGLSLEGEPGDAVGPFVRAVRALRTGPPSVAFVDGVARGAGVGLAAACDLVVASARADFALTEAWFGLWPAAIHPLLVERMRPAAVRRGVITGQSWDAQAALELGLVDERAESLAAAEAFGVASRRASGEAIRAYKAATAPLDEVAAGAKVTAERLRDPEVRRRIAAFAEGFAPWA